MSAFRFFKEKSEQALYRLLRRGWAGGIRTCGMPESKSGALPLGDIPISGVPSPGAGENGVSEGTRTLGLQSHNLTR